MRRCRIVAAVGAVLALFVSGPSLAAEEIVRATLRVGSGEAVVEATIARGWHVNAHQPRDKFLIPTTVEFTPPVGTVRYPTPVERKLAFSGDETLLLYEGTVRIVATRSGVPAGPLRAKLRYQACDDTRCLPPRTIELTATDVPPAPASAADGGNAIAGLVERWGYPLTFVWVAVLGLALNLTPCVYPLISVTIAFFGGRSAAAGGRVVGRALLYVLGICLTFSALGVAAALTGALFGAALQQPVVLGTIALLMAALACGNFGLYQIRMPSGVMQFAGRGGEGAFGALFMGLTMGIVAAPCIGPIVAALLLFVGAQQSVPLGFGLFFALAVGMGAPYVGLAVVAGRLRRLPRSGAWLVWMEWLFGFLLLGLALHFATPLLPALWTRVAWAVLLGSAGVMLGFRGPVARPVVRWARAVAGVVVLVLGVSGLFVAEGESPIAWTPYSDDALHHAAAESRPVFIDFQAEWCIPCREMDHTTFRDPAVVRASGAFTMLRADVTAQDEQATTLMERFRVAGVPTYVLLGPDGAERWRQVGYVPAADLLRALGTLTTPDASRG